MVEVIEIIKDLIPILLMAIEGINKGFEVAMLVWLDLGEVEKFSAMFLLSFLGITGIGKAKDL